MAITRSSPRNLVWTVRQQNSSAEFFSVQKRGRVFACTQSSNHQPPSVPHTAAVPALCSFSSLTDMPLCTAASATLSLTQPDRVSTLGFLVSHWPCLFPLCFLLGMTHFRSQLLSPPWDYKSRGGISFTHVGKQSCQNNHWKHQL